LTVTSSYLAGFPLRVLQSSDSVTQKPPASLADRHLWNAQTFANLNWVKQSPSGIIHRSPNE
jgi:hypothetical protein